MTKSLSDLLQTNDFTRRHIGPSEAEQAEMLGVLGVSSLDELTQTNSTANCTPAPA